MQFDPIYARRTSLLRGALINQHSHSLENLTGLDLNKERSAHSALAILSPRATTERRVWPPLTYFSFFFILAQVAIFDRVKFNY